MQLAALAEYVAAKKTGVSKSVDVLANTYNQFVADNALRAQEKRAAEQVGSHDQKADCDVSP